MLRLIIKYHLNDYGTKISRYDISIWLHYDIITWLRHFLARRVVYSGKGKRIEKVDPQEIRKVFKEILKTGLKLKMPIGFGDPFPHLLLSPKRQTEALENPDVMNGNIVGGCSVSIDSMYITQNGDVLLCPYLPIYCGSVKKTSIKDLWINSETYKMSRSIRSHLK